MKYYCANKRDVNHEKAVTKDSYGKLVSLLDETHRHPRRNGQQSNAWLSQRVKEFLYLTPKAKKKNIDPLDFIKVKNSCSATDAVERRVRQPYSGRKYLQIPVLTKDLVFKVYKVIRNN